MKTSRRPIQALALLGGIIAFSIFLSYATPLHRTLFEASADALGIKGGFGSSRLFLLLGELTLKEVLLEDIAGRYRLEASRIRISVSPLSLLRGKLIVSHLDLDNPTLQLRKGRRPERIDPHLLSKILVQYEDSVLLKNLTLKDVRVRGLALILTGGSPSSWSAGEVGIKLEPTLFREIRLELTASAVKQEGVRTKDLAESVRINLVLSPSRLRLTRFDLKGAAFTLGVKGELQGDLEKGTVSLGGQFLPPKVLDLPVSFHIETTLTPRALQIRHLEAQLAKATLEGQGEIDKASRHYAIDFQARDVSLEAIFHKLPGTLLAPSRGLGELKGRAEGNFPAIQVRADAVIREFRHRGLAAARGGGEIRLTWPELHFDADIQTRDGGPKVGEVSGSVAFRPLPDSDEIRTQPQRVDLAFQEVPLQEVLPETKLKGWLTGQLPLKGIGTSVQGTGHAVVKDLWVGPLEIQSLQSQVTVSPSTEVRFEKTVLEIGNLDPLSFPSPLILNTGADEITFEGSPSPRLKVRAAYQPKTRQFRINEAVWRSDAGTLQIRGEIQETLDLTLHGVADLATLKLFPQEIANASGPVHLDARLTGTAADPQLQGQMEVRNGKLDLRALPDSIAGLEGVLTLSGKKVSSQLKGDYGEGRFQMRGSLVFAGLEPETFDLQLVGSSLMIRRGKDLSVELNPNVTLKGRWPAPLLAGRIDLVDGRYTREFELREFVLRPVIGEKRPPPQPSPWDQVELSLEAKSAGDLQIRNNLATLFLTCDLKIQGKYQQPRYRGSLELVEGTFDYLAKGGGGRKFTLTEGRMEFVDPDRTEPYLLIRGDSEIPPDYLVSVKIEGYLDNLELHFSSIPPRSREDILSLVAFGLTREELQFSGGGGSDLGQQIVWQEASRPFEGLVSQTFGVDIQMEPSAGNRFSPTRFSVGRELTDRLSLEVKSDFSPEVAERTVQANYYLTDNVLLKGFRTRTATTAPHYQFNLSLRFRVQ